MAFQRPTHRLNALFLSAMGDFYRAWTPSFNREAPSSSCPPPPPCSLLPLTQTSLYLPIMCSLSFSFFSGLTLFSAGMLGRIWGETHTHTHSQSNVGGKGWFGNPAKYFIHGSAICLRSLIPIWCYLLSLSSRGFLFFRHILFSGQIISSYQPFSINTQTATSTSQNLLRRCRLLLFLVIPSLFWNISKLPQITCFVGWTVSTTTNIQRNKGVIIKRKFESFWLILHLF